MLLKKETEGWVIKVRRLESEAKEREEEIRKSKLGKVEVEVALKREREERAKEREELARLRSRVVHLEREKAEGEVEQHVNFHIPLKDNMLFGRPSVTTSLDDTEECFRDDENGVGCLHACLRMQEGKYKEMRFRRKTKMTKLVKR